MPSNATPSCSADGGKQKDNEGMQIRSGKGVLVVHDIERKKEVEEEGEQGKKQNPKRRVPRASKRGTGLGRGEEKAKG
eukprot:Skav213270  [mRNA]  locus=scaffold2944:81489:81946:+ [translate_table: standard]